MTQTESFHAGYVALIGLPNVGKSTFLNAVLDFKLSIVSRKPQTTRKKVLGILNDEKHQIIFLDTPGILLPDYELQSIMREYIDEAIDDADIICMMIDISSDLQNFQSLSGELLTGNKPVILVLNKIDLVNQSYLVKIRSNYQNLFNASECFSISAKTK